MDKRDEIREGLKVIIANSLVSEHTTIVLTTGRILEYLDSIGVVIKKEGELPEYVGCTCASDDYTKSVAVETQLDMLKAGYGTFERLIKETDDITKPG